MGTDKQSLLKRYRRNRRLGVALAIAVIAGAGGLFAWWLPFPLAALAWIAHETWLSDHHFYSPRHDYRFAFPAEARSFPATLGKGGRLTLPAAMVLDPADTLLLEVNLRSGLSGCLLDPAVVVSVGDVVDVQVFERNSRGVRFVNLTGLSAAVAGLSVHIGSRHCRLDDSARLWVFRHPDYLRKRLLVIAPHADDAELAAFGLYSQAGESWVVTLTAGEVEAGYYRKMGYPPAAAALLKGRLRGWDSVAIPRWAGVPANRSLQLGYFCLQLPAMQAAPGEVIGSREAGIADTRPFRVFNEITLPGDAGGLPTWGNLQADLLHILDLARPEVIVLPHPELDPHPDHVCAYRAVTEALAVSTCRPETLLCYANHLHNNDRWPMGDAHSGVPLPPHFGGVALGAPYSLAIGGEVQRDKAMALGMMHDLRPQLPVKKRLRRRLQSLLIGRRWPRYGDNEFFRKAVRRHELFWAHGPAPSAGASAHADRKGGLT